MDLHKRRLSQGCRLKQRAPCTILSRLVGTQQMSVPCSLMTPFLFCHSTFQRKIFCLDMTVVQCNQLFWFTFIYTTTSLQYIPSYLTGLQQPLNCFFASKLSSYPIHSLHCSLFFSKVQIWSCYLPNKIFSWRSKASSLRKVI